MKCPKCEALLEGIATVGPLAPMEGDLTLCIDCGESSIFLINDKGELDLRLPKTSKEIFECKLAVATLIAYAKKEREKEKRDINLS